MQIHTNITCSSYTPSRFSLQRHASPSRMRILSWCSTSVEGQTDSRKEVQKSETAASSEGDIVTGVTARYDYRHKSLILMLLHYCSRSTPVVKWMLSNVAPHLVWVGKWQPAHPLFRGITFESGQEESRLGVFRWFVGCAKGSSSPAFLKRSQSHFACSPRACSSGPQVKQHSHRGPPGCHRDPTYSLSKRRQFLTGMHRSVSRAEAESRACPLNPNGPSN